MQGSNDAVDHAASMRTLIYGLREQLTACSPRYETNGNGRIGSGEGLPSAEEQPPPNNGDRHILPDASTSFDMMMDVKMAQKRARKRVSTMNCALGGSSRIRSEQLKEQLNWFNNPCEIDASSFRKRDGAWSRTRSQAKRSASVGGAPASLLEASRKEFGPERERARSSARASSRHGRSRGADGSVTSGVVSTASYARDMYSTTSLGSKTDRASRCKSPSIVTFETSIGKKKRPPKVPKQKPVTRPPTKLHGLIMELSSLPTTSSSIQVASLWAPVSGRVRSRPKEAACLDRRYRSPLSLACEFGNDVPIEIITSLIEAHPDAASTPDRKGCYPIHYYVSSDRGGRWKRSAEVLAEIIDAFPDAALKTNKIGQTPLLAAMQSYPSCLHGVTSQNMGDNRSAYDARAAMLEEIFRENPLAASIPDQTYSFPLHYASKSGPNQTLLLDLIQQCPAALAARDNFGATPLLLAVHWDAEIDILRTLVAACPSAVSVRDERGETPLTHAWNTLVYAGRDRTREDRIRTNEARRAINEATSLQSLEKKSPKVLNRWRKIELLLRASYTEVVDNAGGNRDDGKSKFGVSSPKKGSSRWLPIHATCGSAVPPELVRFAMQIFPGEAGTVDDNGRLPLHVAAGTAGYIRLPFEKKKSKKKVSTDGMDECSTAPVRKSRQQSLLGHLLHEYPKGAATKDRGGWLPLHYAARAGRAWMAIPEDGEEGGMEELVYAEPRAVRTRDETNGMFPFMYLAMKDDQRGPHRSYKERRSRAEQRARNVIQLPEKECASSEEWEAKLQEMLEREEVQEMNSLYRLIRFAPDILTPKRRRNSRQNSNSDIWVDQEHERTETSKTELGHGWNESMQLDKYSDLHEGTKEFNEFETRVDQEVPRSNGMTEQQRDSDDTCAQVEEYRDHPMREKRREQRHNISEAVVDESCLKPKMDEQRKQYVETVKNDKHASVSETEGNEPLRIQPSKSKMDGRRKKILDGHRSPKSVPNPKSPLTFHVNGGEMNE